MKVLVTGGAGYIGSHTIVELVKEGFDVVSVDNYSNSNEKVYKGIEHILGQHIEHYFLDCSVCDQVLNFSKKHKFDAIIHFAAFKSVTESVQHPIKYIVNNLFSLAHVIEYFPKVPIIFSSSCTVYGNPEHLPITEDSPFQITSPYGQTKITSEEMLKGRGNAISLRYFNPIGAHPTGLIGEAPLGTPQNLLPYLLKVAAKEVKTLKVFGNDYNTVDGTCVRDYIYIVDLAKAHVKALEKLLKEPMYDVYNIGTGKGVSVLELIKTFEKATWKKIPYEIAPRREGDIEKIYADTSKANQELNWKAETSLKKALKTAWLWKKLQS